MSRAEYGYRRVGGKLLRNEGDLEALSIAKSMLESGSSYREAARYIKDSGATEISHEGLRLRLQKPVNMHSLLSDDR